MISDINQTNQKQLVPFNDQTDNVCVMYGITDVGRVDPSFQGLGEIPWNSGVWQINK